jgi:hypothetical protein
VSISINPGSDPVSQATEEHATANMAAFTDDLRARGLDVDTFIRRPDSDYGEGRYAYTLAMSDGRSVEIQMPGLSVDHVRYLGEDGQNIWDFPRLYVDDSSWVWNFALDMCGPDEGADA